jgi:hypothetical protein
MRDREASGRALLREKNEHLWTIAVSPTIWAVHFLLCYATAAVWCAKVAGRTGTLAPARWAIAAYTLVALAGIAWVGAHGWRAHRYAGGKAPHGADSSADRHRLLGAATALLSGLSAVAVIYAALVAVFVETCE